jgi:speckle-type POZ protein
MEEDSLPMVKKLIDYFYTADYNENVDQPNTESHQRVSILQVHARMFALADKYDIEGLRQLSLGKFRKANSALELLESVPDVYT